MSRASRALRVLAMCVAASVCVAGLVLANGGPFVVKYPDGDPAAKGVLARIDPDLKPARETRLRVVREDLTITFGKENYRRVEGFEMPPLAFVSAAYTIENPTDEEVTMDFGFPILRGIYMDQRSMFPRPDVTVMMGEKYVKAQVISNSAIYGIIRQRAREAIDAGVQADPALAGLVAAVREAKGADRVAGRATLAAYLTGPLKWNERDAALMVEYASLDFGQVKAHPRDRGRSWTRDEQLNKLLNENLGALSAIGEQKATQFFAHLASRFDPEAGAAYEAIFQAWGGDVRERSVDLATGELRPREITVDTEDEKALAFEAAVDPTIYARVDYFDENAKITEAEKASCKAVLKNLPVIFTFAPMNLIYYNVKFPANETKQLTVSYTQYAYKDTAGPASYQLAYVVHPASMWDEFGPINLEVAVPDGVPFRASVQCDNDETVERDPPVAGYGPKPKEKTRYDIYRATLADKTGEIFMGVDASGWRAVMSGAELTAQVYETPSGKYATKPSSWPVAALALIGSISLIGASVVVRNRRGR